MQGKRTLGKVKSYVSVPFDLDRYCICDSPEPGADIYGETMMCFNCGHEILIYVDPVTSDIVF